MKTNEEKRYASNLAKLGLRVLEPDVNLRMSWWLGDYAQVYEEAPHTCGTPACLMGHSEFLFPRETAAVMAEARDINEEARAWCRLSAVLYGPDFGFDGDLADANWKQAAEFLFCASWRNCPVQAAARVLVYLENGGPPEGWVSGNEQPCCEEDCDDPYCDDTYHRDNDDFPDYLEGIPRNTLRKRLRKFVMETEDK